MSEIRIDLILIIYIIICILMILFNTAYLLYLRYKDYLFKGKKEKIRQIVREQVLLVSKNSKIDENKQSYLFRRLTKVKVLKAFHDAIKEEVKINEKNTFRYLKLCKPLFEYVLIEFDTKENTKKAYLAFLISEFRLCDDASYDFIVSVMISYTMNKSVYVRQNALYALYTSNNSEAILTAMLRMQELNIKHNNKLISDGLLLFQGDRAKLASLLWKEFDRFDINIRIAIINFIKVSTLDYAEPFLALLKNKYTHKEIKLAIIRYFGKIYYASAGEYLVSLMKQENLEWEYKAIGASALAKYKSKEVIDVLKDALKSNNWYIRYNASESLVSLDVEYMELVDIYNGADRYAREILEYKIETARLKKKANQGE